MKINDLTKISFSVLFTLAIISCSLPSNLNEKIEQSNTFYNKNVITGKVEFPKTKNIKSNDNNLNYKTQATLSNIGDRATISLIYSPDDDLNPNVTIATGLSDSNGDFAITTPNFEPITNKVYILEAIKRMGASGNDLISVRTYLRYNGTNWESITSPSIIINKETTSITIIDKNDSSISSGDTIGKILNGIVNPIGNISTSTINNVSNMVSSLIIDNLDPTRFIDYKNNKYFITRETSANKNYLITNKSCSNCDLTGEDLSNLDLSSSDLSNANLKNADLTSTNLSNTDLSNSNISLTNFTGAIWLDGITVCQTDSIGLCRFQDFLNSNYSTNNQNNPSIAIDNSGNFVVTWESINQAGVSSYSDIYAQRYNSNGVPQGSEFRVNTYTTNNQNNPLIAMNSSGNYVITWSGSDGRIYAQRYNNNGTPQGGEFTISNSTASSKSITIDNSGSFVITWESNGNGIIYARKYSSNGVPQSSEFIVNNNITYFQQNPSIATDNNGNFIITWASYQDTLNDGFGVYSQRYNSNGIAQGSKFRVNTFTSYEQNNSSIATDSNGNFIIVWDSYGQDGDDFGVYAKRYNSNGVPQGSEFRVNTFTTYRQGRPSISINNQGNFIIVWNSYQDKNGFGVYGQRFDSNGVPQGSEFRVNTYTTNNQYKPKVAMDNLGNYVITWVTTYSYLTNGQTYLKRYDSNGNQK